MKQVIVFFCFLITTHFVFSQTVTIIDAETGKSIDAVAIYNSKKSKSAISNTKGMANISDFTSNETLIFSHVTYTRYTTKKKEITRNHNIVYLSKQSEQLDEVVLSMFKNVEKTNRIAEQIAVITRKDITTISPQTSADLLANIPGVKIQKSQLGGGSPILRGMESNRVLLVIDGIRMNNAIYRKGHLQNSITVSPNVLDKTEIVFGPSSVTYGSDALGGVIHYYTKTPKTAIKNNIESSFFSRYNTANNEITNVASLELQFKKWASFTNISHSNFEDLKMGKNRSHGFKDWGKVSFYSNNFNGNYTETPSVNTKENVQRNTGYHQTDFLQKFYIPLSSKTNLTFNIQYSTSSNIPRFDKLTEVKDNGELKFAEWYYGPQKRLLASSQLQINPKKHWLEKGVFTFAYQNIKESRIQRKFGSLDRSYRNENVDVYSFNADFTVPLATNRNLGYGAEIAYNYVQSNAFGKTIQVVNNEITGLGDDFAVQSRYPDGGSNYISSALYIDYRQDVSSKATLNSGVRLTNTSLNAKWNNEQFITLPDNNIHLNNTSLTATLGYAYKPNKNWQLNTVISSGFRSPNIDDVGKVREKNGNITVPNVNLKPEHAYNVEFGVLKYFNHRKFRIDANVYYTLLNNYIYREAFNLDGNNTILFDNEEGNIVANVNKGNAYVTGCTLNYQGKLHKNWKTSGFITYTKGKTYDTNQPMSSIPPLFGQIEIQYIRKKLEGGIKMRFNAKKDINDYNIEEGIDNHTQTPIINTEAEQAIDIYYGTPSWMTFGVFGKYKILSNIFLQASINNIFDQHYKEFASGISAPGRNFSIEVHFQL
jgi:hemoglobin/transferrin/lactoferrin receptor protein